MRYQTEAVGETTWLLGELPSGGAVTITLYKLSDSSTPALDSNACTEIGATGIYKWATTNITTPETTKTEYLYIMTDGTLNYPGKIVVGGYVDNVDEKASDIKTQTDKMNFTGTDIKATLDGEKVVLTDATETQIDNIETDLNTPDQYKADVSTLALEDGGRLQNVEADTNEMQGKLPTNNIMGSSVKTDKDDEIDVIKTETDKIQPEIIDKKDEYKATGFAKPGDVKCGGGGGGAIIERPDIWKPEEKLKLIEDIKKMYKMISELSSLQSVGLQNVKKNIEDFKNSLIKLIKEEVTLLISLKLAISKQPQTDSSDALADSVNQLITKWDSVQKSILKSSDLSSLDNKLDDLSKIMAKSLSNKDLEELINAE